MSARTDSIWLVTKLTARQLETLDLARQGLRQAEIAERLNVSSRQIYRILNDARHAMGAKTNHELVAKAISAGLLDSSDK